MIKRIKAQEVEILKNLNEEQRVAEEKRVTEKKRMKELADKDKAAAVAKAKADAQAKKVKEMLEVKLKQRLAKPVQPPFTALQSFNATAHILSYLDYDQDVELLLN